MNFKGFKRTLLEWAAIQLYENPKANVNTLIAIPYNPYEPEPYNRWTMRGMIDLENELKVAKEFWDFIGGQGAYENLLDCFEKVGIEMREEIDKYFSRYLNSYKFNFTLISLSIQALPVEENMVFSDFDYCWPTLHPEFCCFLFCFTVFPDCVYVP